jgi:hypothetical protein
MTQYPDNSNSLLFGYCELRNSKQNTKSKAITLAKEKVFSVVAISFLSELHIHTTRVLDQ